MNTQSPILLLVFNRPDTTKRVFEAVRLAQPPKLYVAADGPRTSRVGELVLCEETRRIATAVDWPCEVVTLFRDTNLGCKKAVSSAITWFFGHEPEGIVLEDDCVPDPSFFGFCDELLARYRDDDRVMCVSGDNFISSHWQPDESYYFSRYAHIWGWASWARAWKHYRADLTLFDEGCIEDVLEREFSHSEHVRAHWRTVLTQVAEERIDTWDYQWAYALWRMGGLSCMPSVNMISNIGFGDGATHTSDPENKLANLAVGRLSFPLMHPYRVEVSRSADLWTEQQIFAISADGPCRRLASRAANRARKLIKALSGKIRRRAKNRAS